MKVIQTRIPHLFGQNSVECTLGRRWSGRKAEGNSVALVFLGMEDESSLIQILLAYFQPPLTTVYIESSEDCRLSEADHYTRPSSGWDTRL